MEKDLDRPLLTGRFFSNVLERTEGALPLDEDASILFQTIAKDFIKSLIENIELSESHGNAPIVTPRDINCALSTKFNMVIPTKLEDLPSFTQVRRSTPEYEEMRAAIRQK